MTDLLMVVATRTALVPAILVNPFLIARHMARGADAMLHAALWGVAAIGLNVGVPVLVFYSGLPVTGGTLACAHWLCLALLVAALVARRLPLRPATCPGWRALGLLACAFAVLVLPVTHMVGVDTYKFQDLASSVHVEKTIPWVVHPVSLLGFTPRSYSSAHPLVLAGVQAMGGLGVDWGFYVVSLLSGLCGLFGAALLARRVTDDPRTAVWSAYLLASAPAFLLFNHWATPRGFIVSLLPMFVWGLLEWRTVRGVCVTIVCAGLLVLSHKVGMVAVVVVPALLVGSVVLPRTERRWPVLVLLVPVIALSVMAAPGPLPRGLLWNMGYRLGMLAPLSLFGLVAVGGWPARKGWRPMMVGALGTFWLACAGGPGQEYGALVALPFAAFAGAAGIVWLRERSGAFGVWTVRVAAAAAAILALMTVGYRSRQATSADVYEVAQYLEAYDPLGPFRVTAPEGVRKQVQAYVTGCPRFEVERNREVRLQLGAPPKPSGSLRGTLREWISYARGFLRTPDVRADWYGKAPRDYYVLADGAGSLPPAPELLFQSGSVELYKPAEQPAPEARGPGGDDGD